MDEVTGDETEAGTGDGLSRRAFTRALGSAAVGGAFAGHAPAAMPPAQAAATPEGLTFLSATELATRLRAKQISAREVMAAHLAQIARVNPKVNAIVTLVAERALADAARADDAIATSGPRGVLHGLPIAHKDLVATAGIRTTWGSPFHRDTVPTQDAPIVTRIRAAGAIAIGKTNTPEFGAGSQTFNTVFGATRNPYDPSKTCGGSSGGAAVALACGLIPIADGSDAGGSLRNPAAFCNVVGLRPSPGRVLRDTASWSPFSVSGPMARSVADVALFLSVLAGDPTVARWRFSRTAPASRPRSTASPRARAWRGGRGSAASPWSPRSAPWSTPTGRSSRISAARSRTPSPTSPASPRRSRRFAASGTTRPTRRSCASGPSG